VEAEIRPVAGAVGPRDPAGGTGKSSFFIKDPWDFTVKSLEHLHFFIGKSFFN